MCCCFLILYLFYTKVASYEFELPISVNKPASYNLYNSQDMTNSESPMRSEFFKSTRGNPSAPVAQSGRKTSRHSLMFDLVPKRPVTAIGLKHALKFSRNSLSFRIPIKYLEKLKEGGFYEAKVSNNIYDIYEIFG